MSSIAHLSDAVETLLMESGSDLPRAARQRLVFFVLGVLLAGSIALRRVATTHANNIPPSPRLGEGGRGVRASSASGRHLPKTLHLKGVGVGAKCVGARYCP